MNCSVAKIAVSAATYWIDKPYDYLIPREMNQIVQPGMRVLVPFSAGNRPSEGIVLALAEESSSAKLKSIIKPLDESPLLSPQQMHLALWMHERYFCTVYECVKAMLPAGLWYELSSRCALTEGWSREEALEAAGRSENQRRVVELLLDNGGSCDYRLLQQAFENTEPDQFIRALAKKGVLSFERSTSKKVRDKTQGFALLNVPAEEAILAAAAKKRSAPSQAAVLKLLADFGGASLSDIRYLTGASAPTVKRLEQEELVTIEQVDVFRRPVYKAGDSRPLPELNESQQAAYEGISLLNGGGKAGAALLYGVTGSGKTQVYARLISDTLKKGCSAILMVPEIALTPQMLQTFSSYFGEEIAVVHSSLSLGERYDEWKRIKSGLAHVIIGTRSAVFAPANDLGLIIIDEEQEESYKSENAPRYHARDVAKYLCAQAGCLLLLGSATPNIESSYCAQIGKYSLFKLPDRYNQMLLPSVEIVDMKRELRDGNGSDISRLLRQRLEQNLNDGKQSILFLNRRGTNKLISCRECGFTYRCPRCSVNLTYHGANKRLMCHYCGHSQRAEEYCPQCGGLLSFIGSGTQKLEQELLELFPEVGIIRMDTDTVSGAGSHEVLLSRFREEHIPILIGTQMVTKGLDFPDVTLVGVISADLSLYSGDYRATERTFSLLTQVVGRSGRGDVPGRAVIQTFTPQNQVILQAAAQDYDGFYKSELELRRLQWSPPFSTLFTLTASGQNEAAVLRCITAAKQILTRELCGRSEIRLLGPAPLPVLKVNNRFRYRLTLACPDQGEIRRLISGVIYFCSTNKEFKGVSVFGDINPLQ